MFFPILVCVAVSLIVVAWAFNTSSPGLRDASLQVNLTLPSGTSAVTSTGIDTGLRGPNDFFPEGFEFLIEAPSLNTSQLPDGKTMSYSIAHSPNADMSGATVQYTNVLVQTGAGGIGAVAAQARAKLPHGPIGQYVGLIATPSASGAGDASAAKATLSAVF